MPSSEVQLEDLREEEPPATVPGPELPLVRMPRGSSPEPHKLSRERDAPERVPKTRRPGFRAVQSSRGNESSSTDRVGDYRQLYKTILKHMLSALDILKENYKQDENKKAQPKSNRPLTVRMKDHRKNLYETN